MPIHLNPTTSVPALRLHSKRPGDTKGTAQRKEPETRGIRAGSKRVLVVDDSLHAREQQRALLTRRGYEVEVAVDGVDGWNALRAKRFDLVLVDIDMPLVDGLRLTRLIRKNPQLETLPVLVLCDEDTDTQRRRGFEAGADYYVIKDRMQDTLLPAVASLIGRTQS